MTNNPDPELIEVMARAIATDVVSGWNLEEREGDTAPDFVNRCWREWESTAQAALQALQSAGYVVEKASTAHICSCGAWKMWHGGPTTYSLVCSNCDNAEDRVK